MEKNITHLHSSLSMAPIIDKGGYNNENEVKGMGKILEELYGITILASIVDFIEKPHWYGEQGGKIRPYDERMVTRYAEY